MPTTNYVLTIRLWHYLNISIILFFNAVPLSVALILNAVMVVVVRHIQILTVISRVLIVHHLHIAFIHVRNSYYGFMILRPPIIQPGYDLLLIGFYLILLQLSKIRGYIIPLLPRLLSCLLSNILLFFFYLFPLLPSIGLNIIIFAIHLFNRGYVVSSGIQFIFIMSYGIYSVDKCLISVLYDCSVHYILNTCSLYFEYVRTHVCLLSHE